MKLVDARELAERLGFTRDWVYAHADELGVYRLGGGNTPRLRFDLDRILAREDTAPAVDDPPPARTKRADRPRAATSAPLLPIRGETPEQTATALRGGKKARSDARGKRDTR